MHDLLHGPVRRARDRKHLVQQFPRQLLAVGSIAVSAGHRVSLSSWRALQVTCSARSEIEHIGAQQPRADQLVMRTGQQIRGTRRRGSVGKLWRSNLTR